MIMMQTLSEENYLKAIYHIAGQGSDKVSVTAVSEALGNNPASVVDMLKKLTKKKLIQYDKSNGAKFTEKGLKSALLVVRKHRLWEVFLHSKLGYNWDEVHAMAEQLEHIQHLDLADRLEKFLGFPEYDPHGDPIPKSNGQMPNTFKKMLSETDVGESCTIVAVKDTSSVFLQYLQHLSITIGTKVKVLERIQFDGSMTIQIRRDLKTTVSRKFAESLLVD
jgi:DtxR family Mn-dependent transcriptional regulator